MKKITTALAMLGFALLSFFQITFGQWEQTGGPLGGQAEHIVTTNEYFFTTISYDGLYRIHKDSTSWTKLSLGSTLDTEIRELVSYNNILYVSVNTAICRSKDNGLTWELIEIEGAFYIDKLTVNENTIVASNYSGDFFFSDDSGVSWSHQALPNEDHYIADILYFDGKIYAAGNKLLVSDDNCVTWDTVNIPNIDYNVTFLTNSDSTIYVCLDSRKVYKSTDTTQTWINTGINPNGSIFSIKINNNKCYAIGSNGNIIYSDNEFTDWENYQNEKGGIFTMQMANIDDTYLMVSNKGVFKSENNLNEWSEFNSNLKSVSFESIVVLGDTIIAAGNNTMGIFKSVNNGKDWVNIHEGFDQPEYINIKDIHVIQDAVYLATESGIYKSTDFGETWKIIYHPGVNIGVYQLDEDAGIIGAMVSSKGFIYSEDNGINWITATNSNLNLQTTFLSMDMHNDTIVLSTTSGEVYISEDLGENWQLISIDNNWVLETIIENNIIYACQYNGVYYSEDWGKNWVDYSYGLYETGNPYWAYDLEIINNKKYLGTNKGVFVFSELEKKWYPVNNNIENTTVRKLGYNDDYLFAATYYSSVWKISHDSINISPEITGSLALSTKEDSILNINLSDLIVNDADNVYPNDFSLSIFEGENYTFTENIIKPDTNYFGNLTIPISVNDGISESNLFNLTVEITPVNDFAQVSNTISAFVIAEDSILTLVPSQFEIIDPDNGMEDMSIVIKEGDRYTFENNILTPEKDLVDTLAVTIAIFDGTDYSEDYTFDLKITPVNDKPVITSVVDTLKVNEDGEITLSMDVVAFEDVDGQDTEDFSLVILEGENYSLNNLTVYPEDDFFGKLEVIVAINDGVENSNADTLFIDVLPINDAPIIDNVVDTLYTYKNTAFEILLEYMTITDVDNNADDFSVIIREGENYSCEGNVITPASDYLGTLSIEVFVSDGIDTSSVYDVILEVKNNVGINDNLISALAVYPNPFTDNFTLNYGYLEGDKTIKIYNTSGELIYEKTTIDDEKSLINLANQPKGIYLIQVIYFDNIKTFRIIKE